MAIGYGRGRGARLSLAVAEDAPEQLVVVFKDECACRVRRAMQDEVEQRAARILRLGMQRAEARPAVRDVREPLQKAEIGLQ